MQWCMPFADDIVLVDESQIGLSTKLELWKETLESKGFKISRTKMESVEYKKSTREEIVSIDGKPSPK